MKALESASMAGVKLDMLAAEVGTGGLKEWMAENLVGVAVLAIGIVLMWMSRQRQHGNTMEIVGGVLIGLVVIGMSFGTTATEVGKFFVDLVVTK